MDSSKTDWASINLTGLSLVKIMYLQGCSFFDDGAHLAASNIESNFDLSTGFVENALALHRLAISSFTGCPVFAILVIISSVTESPILAANLGLIFVSAIVQVFN